MLSGDFLIKNRVIRGGQWFALKDDSKDAICLGAGLRAILSALQVHRDYSILSRVEVNNPHVDAVNYEQVLIQFACHLKVIHPEGSVRGSYL